MKVSIEKIGKIQSTTINVNGLTVIAGANDSGKSTFSKILFSTVKASAAIEQNSSDAIKMYVSKHVRALYRRLNNISLFLRRDNRFSNYFPIPSSHLVDALCEMEEDELFEQIKVRVEYLSLLEELSPRDLALIQKDFDTIRICILDHQNPAAQMAMEIRTFIESEFINKITSFSAEKSSVSVSVGDDEPCLSYDVYKEDISEIHYDENLMKNFFKDATYVESPLYLHLLDVLRQTSTYCETAENRMGRPMAPMHIKDLADKLSRVYATTPNDVLYPEIKEQISSIEGGRFFFDSKSRRLLFKKGKNIMSPINVASGLKSFGVLQILLQTDAIGPDRPLLWDEPENHMHPDWQIHFAEILVQLVKAGVPVVISTHSPYFVQAIRYYAVKYRLEKFVDYYLAEERENGLSVVENVNEDLNRIFVKLSEPLHRIMNIATALED